MVLLGAWLCSPFVALGYLNYSERQSLPASIPTLIGCIILATAAVSASLTNWRDCYKTGVEVIFS
jgi:hypothetical protein